MYGTPVANLQVSRASVDLPKKLKTCVAKFKKYRMKRRLAESVCTKDRYLQPVTSKKGNLSFVKKVQQRRFRMVHSFRPEDDVNV